MSSSNQSASGNSLLTPEDIVRLDEVVFNGNRSARIKDNLRQHPDFVWTIYDEGSLEGYALAWKYPNSLRLSPIICNNKRLPELFKKAIGALVGLNTKISVLAYEDDEVLVKLCMDYGFKVKKREQQLCCSDERERQHPMLRTIWGRATG